MTVTQTHRGPIDTHAERAALAAGLWNPQWHWETRCIIDNDDHGHVEHQQISRALDELADVGPFVPDTYPVLDRDAWWPSSLHCRISAVATITELNAGAITAIAKYADGLHARHALTILDLSRQRHRILALRLELRDLTE